MSKSIPDDTSNDSHNVEDIDSCLGYLKKREVFLYKMMNDPDHKAMLYFLEVILNSESSTIKIDDLSSKFYCKNFTQDMREACGNNVVGLKKFLERYPALFHVSGSYVSAVSIDMNDKSVTGNIKSSQLSSSNSSKASVKFDINKEMEAVKFFQNKLSKRDEKWVPIKSLAGHLSQADLEIRDLVGPQLDFKKFISSYPQIFEIQGELVSLRELNQNNNANSKRNKLNSVITKDFNKSDIANINRLNRPKSLNVNGSNGFMNYSRDGCILSAPTTPNNSTGNSSVTPFNSRTSSVSMTNNEYRSLMFLRKVIEKRNNSMSLSNLFICLGKTKESIRNVIGWTKFELQEFVRKNSAFFDLTPNEVVVNRRIDRINIIITGHDSLSTDTGMRTLTNRFGVVFHVAKLWGIIDLGKHEHVFFDKSIFKHLDDLQRHFKVGETLYFNAILAPKESRAKWRATQVWKECDREMVEKFCGHILSNTAASNKLLLTHHTNYSHSGIGVGSINDGLSDIASILTEEASSLDEYDYYLDHTSSSIMHGNRSNNPQPLPDDVEAELTKLLQLTNENEDSDYDDDDDDDEEEDPSILANQAAEVLGSPDTSFSQRSTRSEPSTTSHPLSAPAFYHPSHHNNIDSQHSNTNYKQPPVTKVNVSTQTLSTGDIMATNLYHQ